jgi:hypothetical protein
MKLYEDASCRKEIKESLHLGELLGGESKVYEFFIHNSDTRNSLRNIQIKVDNPEVVIVSCPTTLKANESKSFKLQWDADVTLEEGLDVNLEIYAQKVCGGMA